MFEQADLRLKDWIATVLPGTRVDLAAPQEAPAGQGINLYLLGLEAKPLIQESPQKSWPVGLSYLVTTWAEQPETAHQLLGELVFAAFENSEFEVELGGLPMEAWAGFRLAPRPYFVLKTPFHKARQTPVPKYVTKPLSVVETDTRRFYGLAVGPGEIPISGAQVTIPALRQVRYTDANGRFVFPLVPGSIKFMTLQVKIKGRVQEISPDPQQPNSETTPLVIRFELPEE